MINQRIKQLIHEGINWSMNQASDQSMNDCMIEVVSAEWNEYESINY